MNMVGNESYLYFYLHSKTTLFKNSGKYFIYNRRVASHLLRNINFEKENGISYEAKYSLRYPVIPFI